MGQETWVSHSSISDYLKCPRAYYLKNVYRDPQTNRKISVMTPALALGQAVHQVLENLATVRAEERFSVPLTDRLPEAWKAITGKLGGFSDETEEAEYYARAIAMLLKVTDSPGPLARLAVRIQAPGNLPRYALSPEEQLILCGKIDWLEYLPEDDSVRVLDFKTGLRDEHGRSLQLPIYTLLANRLQKRTVSGMSYWYLDREDAPQEIPLPDLARTEAEILQLARDIKWARECGYRVCPEDGCFACRDYQAVLDGGAELVGVGNYGQSIYIIRE